jgi:PAS domain S-box-containing protein
VPTASNDTATLLQSQLLEAVGLAVIATDLDGCITYWNRGAERMFGRTSSEVVGRNDLAHLI